VISGVNLRSKAQKLRSLLTGKENVKIVFRAYLRQ